jgi:hypothetical protein
MMQLTSRAFGSMAAAVLVATCGAAVRAQNVQFGGWTAAAAGGTRPIAAKIACTALVSSTDYDVSIASATVVAASADAPEYCQVSGLIQPEIRFEVALPAAWNGRLYMFGNGGYAGEPLAAPNRAAIMKRALSRGFATAQTNTGHDAAVEPLGTFAASPQKFADYAFRAVHVTAVTAKRLLQTYYDGPLGHAYFDGCSTGGRQGLIAAQRFPADFDGIVVGAPVLNFSGTAISYVGTQRALAAAGITVDQLKVVADAVYAKCDAVDGVKDGLIDDPRRCAFNPSADVPKCTGDAAAGCLTSAQLHTLDTIYGSVKKGDADIFPGWPVGSEVAAAGPNNTSSPGWMPWFIASGPNRPVQALFGETFFKYLAFGKANPTYDWLTFDVNADYDKMQATRAALDAVDPDLSRFKARGGKIVSYYGWADPALNPLMGVGYYESVVNRMGPSTSDFYRLFMVPGMFHCGGGVGTGSFDTMTPLVAWVEQGVAPQSIAASRLVDGKVVRTRPLCPYPETAIYNGTGSIDEAASFTCAVRKASTASR